MAAHFVKECLRTTRFPVAPVARAAEVMLLAAGDPCCGALAASFWQGRRPCCYSSPFNVGQAKRERGRGGEGEGGKRFRPGE